MCDARFEIRGGKLETLCTESWLSVTRPDVDAGEYERDFASIGRSHAAYQILADWTESVDKPIPKQAQTLEVPGVASISEPGDPTEQLFDIAQRIIGLQQMFVLKLIEAVTGQT